MAALVAGVAAVSSSQAAGPRYRTTTTIVASGVTLKEIVDRRGPNRIRVLEVDPSESVTIDVALGTDALPGHETTSSMARRHGAIAAINGDYTLRPGDAGSGRPVNLFVEDGHYKASSLIWGRNFSLSRGETRPRIGHIDPRASLVQASGEVWDVPSVNPLEPDSTFTMYTPAGGKLFKPPGRACSARLLAAGNLTWNPNRNGLSRAFTVDEVVCRARRLKRLGGNVVTVPRRSEAGLAMKSTLLEGETVTYSWALGRRGAMDTIGGNPDLVKNGELAFEGCRGSYFCYRNPRTGVGYRDDGTILMVTVDGRSERSVGMKPEELGRLFVYLGAESALMLDGGGSTTMVVRGRVVNVPSQPFERPVGSALLVLPGEDGGEAEPDPAPSPTPTLLPPAPRATGSLDRACDALTDPGSTGGMLDALQKGLLGPRRVPPSLMWAVRTYRTGLCG